MDKMHRQKTAEIEKLSSTVAELEEAVLAGGAAVNAARDYQRQAQELLVRFMVSRWGATALRRTNVEAYSEEISVWSGIDSAIAIIDVV